MRKRGKKDCLLSKKEFENLKIKFCTDSESIYCIDGTFPYFWLPNFIFRVRQLMHEQDFSQKDLANHLKVAPSTVSKFLSKTTPTPPTTSNIIHTAEFFNVSVDYLLGRVMDSDECFAPIDGNSYLKYGLSKQSLSSFEEIIEKSGSTIFTNSLDPKSTLRFILESNSFKRALFHLSSFLRNSLIFGSVLLPSDSEDMYPYINFLRKHDDEYYYELESSMMINQNKALHYFNDIVDECCKNKRIKDYVGLIQAHDGFPYDSMEDDSMEVRTIADPIIDFLWNIHEYELKDIENFKVWDPESPYDNRKEISDIVESFNTYPHEMEVLIQLNENVVTKLIEFNRILNSSIDQTIDLLRKRDGVRALKEIPSVYSLEYYSIKCITFNYHVSKSEEDTPNSVSVIKHCKGYLFMRDNVPNPTTVFINCYSSNRRFGVLDKLIGNMTVQDSLE